MTLRRLIGLEEPDPWSALNDLGALAGYLRAFPGDRFSLEHSPMGGWYAEVRSARPMADRPGMGDWRVRANARSPWPNEAVRQLVADLRRQAVWP